MFEQARDFLLKAIELDGNYAQAYAVLGVTYVINYQKPLDRGFEQRAWSRQNDFVDRAIEKDPQELIAHVAAAFVATFGADLDRAKAEAQLALTLNPNSAEAYSVLGNAYIFFGPAAGSDTDDRTVDPARPRLYAAASSHPGGSQPPSRGNTRPPRRCCGSAS